MASALDVTCDYCKAKPGQPCEDRGTGMDRERPHFTRAAAAMRREPDNRGGE